MPSHPIPDIQSVPVTAKLSVPVATPAVYPGTGTAIDLREKRIEEFLQARSLALQSQRAYQQDLQRFLNWTEQSWAFKRHLMQPDPETGNRILSDATVNRTLGTIKNFYGWLFRSQYVNRDPTTEVDRLKLKEPTAQNLKVDELELIYQVAADSNLPKRNRSIWIPGIYLRRHFKKAESSALPRFLAL